MTTIAFKDGVLATDTRMVDDDHRPMLCTKIRYISKDIIIACGGDVNSEFRAIQYFSDPDYEVKEPPNLGKKSEFQCILIVKNKAYFCDGALYPQPLEHPHYAIGTGAPYAFAYMDLGHSAEEAVKFASRFDVHTNDIVATYVIPNYAEKKTTKAKPKTTV